MCCKHEIHRYYLFTRADIITHMFAASFSFLEVFDLLGNTVEKTDVDNPMKSDWCVLEINAQSGTQDQHS